MLDIKPIKIGPTARKQKPDQEQAQVIKKNSHKRAWFEEVPYIPGTDRKIPSNLSTIATLCYLA